MSANPSIPSNPPPARPSAAPPLGPSSPPFHLGDCLVEPRELRVQRDGETLRLEPRMLQVLLALARREGGTVTRDELLAEAWAGQVVSDDAIQRAIAKLRAVLSADPKAAPSIETVPKVGYRLCLPLRRAAAADASGAVPPPAASAPVASGSGGSTAGAPAPTTTRYRAVALLAALGVLLLVLLATSARQPVPPAPASAPTLAAPTPQWRPLTGEPGMNSGPAFSPDGRSLVFSRGPLLEEKLWIVDLMSGERRALTSGEGQHINPVWLPDGKGIIFVAKQQNRCALQRIDANGGAPTPLIDCGARRQPRPSVSPDGRWLAVADEPPEAVSQALYLIDLQTGQRRLLLQAPYSAMDSMPNWSPDGASILFVRVLGGRQREIRRVRTDGSDDTLLASVSESVRDLVVLDAQRWLISTTSPEGGRLHYGENHAEPRMVASLGDGAHQLALSPDHRRLAVSSAVVQYSGYRMDLRSGVAEPLPDFLQDVWDMAISPDGSRVAFVRPAGPDGSVPLWIADRQGHDVRLLWTVAGVETTHPVFSHDGSRIAFVRRTGKGSRVCQSTLGGEAHCVADAEARDAAPSFSHDGQRLLFTSNRGGIWRVWSAALDGSDPQPLPLRNSGFAQDSLDGQHRYLRQIERNQLLQVPLPEGAPRVLANDVATSAMHPLLPVPEGVIYFNQHGELRRIDASSGESRVLASFPRVSPPHMSVTADGRLLYYTMNDRQNANITLLENLDELLAAAVQAP